MALVQKYFSWRDVDEIPKIKTSPRHQEDVLAWASDHGGIFSFESAYKLPSDLTPHTSTCAASRASDGNYVV
jgi:hypothetical protein